MGGGCTKTQSAADGIKLTSEVARLPLRSLDKAIVETQVQHHTDEQIVESQEQHGTDQKNEVAELPAVPVASLGEEQFATANLDIEQTVEDQVGADEAKEVAEFLVASLGGEQLAIVTLDLSHTVRDLYKQVTLELGENPQQTRSWQCVGNAACTCIDGDYAYKAWRRNSTIEDLMRKCVQEGYSGFMVGADLRWPDALLFTCSLPIPRRLEQSHERWRFLRPNDREAWPTQLYLLSGEPRKPEEPRFCLVLEHRRLECRADWYKPLREFGVEAGKTSSLTLAYKEYRPRQQDLDRWLQLAAWDGTIEVVERLLLEGASPGPIASPFWSHAYRLKPDDVVRHTEVDALGGAAKNGHLSCVELLLGAKADLETRALGGHYVNHCGFTPLHQACFDNRVQVARSLLRARANLHASCGFKLYGSCISQTALQMALGSGHPELAEMIHTFIPIKECLLYT